MDLASMYNNMGPAGASILAGTQMGMEMNRQQSEDAMRQAQMDKIALETKQAELMNPLLIQSKEQDIKAAQLKQQADERAFTTKLLGDAIPTLEKVKDLPGQRLLALKQFAASQGHPLTDEDLSHYSQQDDLLGALKEQHKWALTQNKEYQLAEMQRASAERIAAGHDATSRYAADSRARTAKDRVAADKSLSQDLSSAKNYQAQAVVYTNHAEKARLAGDDSEYARLMSLAQQATAQDLNAKSAAGDARAAQQLKLLQGLGVPLDAGIIPTTPAAPAPAGSPRKPLSAY